MIKTYNIEFSTTRQETDNGYLISDVALLAEGVWNGITYNETELQKATWINNHLLDKHTDDKGEGATIIGDITNQRFEDGAVKGDIFISNNTEQGKEMIELVKNNQINGISVEHSGNSYQAGDNVLSTDITFQSAAIVQQPACNPCRLSKENKQMSENEIVKLEDFNKLLDTVAEQGETIKKLSEVDVDAVIAVQSRKDLKVIDGLKEQITKLENTPVQNTVVEVEGVEPYAGYSYERGTVSKVI